jgi:hypothetical protein
VRHGALRFLLVAAIGAAAGGFLGGAIARLLEPPATCADQAGAAAAPS